MCLLVGADDAAPGLAERIESRLEVPVQKLSVARKRDVARLATDCSRLTIAIGADALESSLDHANSAEVLYAWVSAPERIAKGRPQASGIPRDAPPTLVFETLARLDPHAKRIGVVYDPARTESLVGEGKVAAARLGLELVALPASDLKTATKAFQRFEKADPVDAIWLLPDATVTTRETALYALELGQWRRVPVIGLSPWYVAHGALFALKAKPEAHADRIVRLTMDRLQGRTATAPATPTDFDLYLNERTADRLQIQIPRDLLERAQEVMP